RTSARISDRQQADLFPCPLTGFCVFDKDGVETVSRQHLGNGKSPLYDNGDVGKAQLALKERRYGYLVGSIQHRRCCASGGKRFGRQTKAGKALQIRSFEVEAPNSKEIQWCNSGLN